MFLHDEVLGPMSKTEFSSAKLDTLFVISTMHLEGFVSWCVSWF